MSDLRQRLRDWMIEHSRMAGAETPIGDATALIEEGILSSVQVPDLILLIEDLRGRPVEMADLKPGAFRSIDAIVQTFFAG